MRTLSRLLLLILCLGVLASAVGTWNESAPFSHGHDSWYILKYPWLRVVREWSLWGDLGWCIIFARREPALVRLGLVCALVTLIIMELPPRTLQHAPWPVTDHHPW